MPEISSQVLAAAQLQAELESRLREAAEAVAGGRLREFVFYLPYRVYADYPAQERAFGRCLRALVQTGRVEIEIEDDFDRRVKALTLRPDGATPVVYTARGLPDRVVLRGSQPDIPPGPQAGDRGRTESGLAGLPEYRRPIAPAQEE